MNRNSVGRILAGFAMNQILKGFFLILGAVLPAKNTIVVFFSQVVNHELGSRRRRRRSLEEAFSKVYLTAVVNILSFRLIRRNPEALRFHQPKNHGAY